MAREAPAETPPADRVPEFLDAAQFGQLVGIGIGRVQTVRDLCARNLVPGASKPGGQWRIHFPTFYEALAGPGVAVGRIVTARQLAGMLGISSRVLRRGSAPPGTAGKFPGLQVGKTWLYALPAVQAQVPWSLDRLAAGQPPAAGPLPAPGPSSPGTASQPGPPAAVFLAPQVLDYPGGAAPQPAVTHGRARGTGRLAGRRQAPPASGTSPAPR
jgi:hypothetical protein